MQSLADVINKRDRRIYLGLMLPTPNDYAGIHAVHSVCRACDRIVPLDLPDLVRRGYGDVPLVHLPLRCAGCGSRDCGISVSGQSYPGWRG